ncbi:hypothetical protein K431DRAFT_283466 [Polychaeton citri CBS 116435]|uniref:FHA domain-containing protein n=1 Tax=Polychaeton citri CBS 116435 TaxID=1314669 RepID=A0A9P4Q995_9PEZI|nr:hypothetical protein K431DRAFT_283466 [Polychaeton citri CBS 116435]
MDASRASSGSLQQSPARPNAPSRQPSLLPAFEPLSSSPGLPRPPKRKLDDLIEERKYYPTPVPTSSTGIPPSSTPPRRTRAPLQRSVSTLSERAPLGDVPTIDIPANGEPLLMGRSSNSSDYQLSANRLISRVHVRASYLVPDASCPVPRVEIECLGWNGAKVHCRGEIHDLEKGKCFVSDNPMSQIMVDVQDTRVLLKWPVLESREQWSESPRQDLARGSPSKRRAVSSEDIASSPPVMLLPPLARANTPPSPTPNRNPTSTFTSTFRVDAHDQGQVQVYEDQSCDEDAPHEVDGEVDACKTPTQDTFNSMTSLTASHSSNPDGEELSEHDEENDPIVHSFGPFGANILDRLDSFHANSPERKRKPLKDSNTNSPGHNLAKPAVLDVKNSPIKNHVINQLAFSRIHSLPLSTIHSNLPAELRGAMTKPSDNESSNVLTSSGLKTILDGIPCVGEISREGKDAAGKLLESEFYYMPEADTDGVRRDTVMQSLGKTSIRAARKQHKQYYWKRPRY